MGCASLELAYLAAGKIDSFYDAGLKQWDIAAGGCIAEHAGATVKLLDGSDIDYRVGDIFAATPQFAEKYGKEVFDVFAK